MGTPRDLSTAHLACFHQRRRSRRPRPGAAAEERAPGVGAARRAAGDRGPGSRDARRRQPRAGSRAGNPRRDRVGGQAGPLIVGGTWIYEPIPGRRVLIITYGCTVLTPSRAPVLSHE